MKRYIEVKHDKDPKYPRQFRIGNTKEDDVNYKLLDWDDYYIEISGFFGNIGPHVFAAAPDLLEALEMAQVWLEYDGRFDMKNINAAIAKAKGETK